MSKHFNIEFKCHWDESRICENNMLCGACEWQPNADDKPHGKDEPKELLWEQSYWNGVEPVCPSCGEMPYDLERCVFCGQKLINTKKSRPPEYKGATLIEPDEKCGFARLRCDKCGEIIRDEDSITVHHADGEDFYTWRFRHKCGNEYDVKHWRGWV